MGWTASDDPFAQIRLTFPTLSAAVDYAEREGIDYVVIEPCEQRPVRKAFVAPGHGLNDDRQNVKQTEQKEKQP